MPGLDEKLEKILQSRRERNILRHLPSGGESHIDFCSNDYLSLSSSSYLRTHFLHRLRISERILGSGGSRLLSDVPGHHALEARLASFFGAPAALLFNSGFDANVGFFASVPQRGDIVLYDEYIHASVHDGMRASRAKNSTFSFLHNDLASLKQHLAAVIESRQNIRSGEGSVFIAVESLYSMDGDFAPLRGIVDMLDLMLPQTNGHLVVDEAHATGLYGKEGRGIVSLLGLENRVTARLHTFGKALASNGAVVLTSPLIRDYLVNYARPFIFTTAITYATVISINCSFDILEADLGQKLSRQLSKLCTYFLCSLRSQLRGIPSELITLPERLCISADDDSCLLSPIIPLLTPHARSLATRLQTLGFLTRPISQPTVPKGMDRLRICIHAGNSVEEIDGLIAGIATWIDARRNLDSPESLSKL